MTGTVLTTFAAALFSMMNPIGNAGIFATMTESFDASQRRRIAMTSAFAAAMFALVTLWAGPDILKLFGISIPALRTAGGLIVLLIGLSMLNGDTSHHHSAADQQHAAETDNPAVVPIAMPLLVGPGTMAVIIANAQHAVDVPSKLTLSAVIIAACVATGLLFTIATPIAQRLGPAGLKVMTRVMGLLLTAIAMGMLADGIAGLIPALSQASTG